MPVKDADFFEIVIVKWYQNIREFSDGGIYIKLRLFVSFNFFSLYFFSLLPRAYFKGFIPQFQEGAFANGKL